jgi:hypothetical protein
VSRVPGTLKQRQPTLVEIAVPKALAAMVAEYGLRCFALGDCRIMVAQEPLGPVGELRWHLSISHPTRYPTWDEIKTARYELTPPKANMVMALPPVDEYVNVEAQDNVFHLHQIAEA